MASHAISNLDLNQKQLLNAVLHKSSTAPESPVKGQIYFNTSSNTFLYYDGTQWISVGDITVDSSLSTISTNPVQNKVITDTLNNKANSSDIGNGTITITQGGTTKGTFSMNQNSNSTINLDGGSSITVDQTYNSTSTNPQSGTAVAGAIQDLGFVATQNINTLSSSSITLSRNYSYYTYTPSASTTFTFNVSSLNLTSSEVYTFELVINMSTVQTLTFPSSLTWLDNEIPDMSNTGTYYFVFRTVDQGTTWIGNLQGVW